ncbi:membrane protein insertion efficiency factor YidD [Leptospira ognonensis]|uniref:Putative membrane protein insertion efficiency factor n=1 Tax=Leptospira ognonensis TaxID=2484945 RepID=A0A4R9JWH5_9LEPT|nr:membrane protein insertion efficiency factor YidD [Leptospira ognonensis]TGL56384.1 membrane protein insertion efficiency factor YidD [Leptospira ognonensis]
MNRIALLLIFLYKKLISPLLPPACRFTPSCSEYAAEAFRNFPFFTALKLSTLRISRCQPFHEGGYDPVPIPNHKS